MNSKEYVKMENRSSLRTEFWDILHLEVREMWTSQHKRLKEWMEKLTKTRGICYVEAK